MPSKSQKQHNFMEAAAHDPGFAAAHHIPTSVAKDFADADIKHPRVCCNGHKARES